MRKIIAGAAAAAIIAAGFPSHSAFAQAQTAAASVVPVDPSAAIQSTLRAFPNGGSPLQAAIADLVAAHPSYASRIAAQLRSDPSLTAAQRQAMVSGLADALNRLGIVAQVGNILTPLQLALLAGAGGLAGWGIYEATKGKSTTPTSVSPN